MYPHPSGGYTFCMAFAPQHDWDAYKAAVSQHEMAKLREQTPVDKLLRYAYLFDMLHALRPHRTWDDPVEIQRWKENREIRMRYVNAFIRPKEQ